MAEDQRGKFVWYELLTSDADAAQKFYKDVVGWKTAPFDDAQMPYTMWMKDDEAAVGGVMDLPEDARKRGVPPHWMAYVAVPDVDATTDRAGKLGGSTIMGPGDIPNVGRFAILADPQGAAITAFKGSQEMPPGNAEPGPGDFSWAELATTDHEGAFDFYTQLFGWEKQEAMDMGEGAGVYQMFGRGGNMMGGMYNKTADQPGPAWLYYITIGDLDEAVKKVTKKGGTIIVEPMEVPGGSRIAVGIDPQGAAFGLHEMAKA